MPQPDNLKARDDFGQFFVMLDPFL